MDAYIKSNFIGVSLIKAKISLEVNVIHRSYLMRKWKVNVLKWLLTDSLAQQVNIYFP